jgi:hypothetical protein
MVLKWPTTTRSGQSPNRTAPQTAPGSPRVRPSAQVAGIVAAVAAMESAFPVGPDGEHVPQVRLPVASEGAIPRVELDRSPDEPRGGGGDHRRFDESASARHETPASEDGSSYRPLP